MSDKPSHTIKITYPIDNDDVDRYFTFKDTVNRFFSAIPRVAGVCAIVLVVIGAYIFAVKFIL